MKGINRLKLLNFEFKGKKLPERGFNYPSNYASLLVVTSQRKHGSGYNLMLIIGESKETIPTEVVGFCDAIDWEIEVPMSMECVGVGVVRYYPYNKGIFEVGNCLSTTTIKLKQVK